MPQSVRECCGKAKRFEEKMLVLEELNNCQQVEFMSPGDCRRSESRMNGNTLRHLDTLWKKLRMLNSIHWRTSCLDCCGSMVQRIAVDLADGGGGCLVDGWGEFAADTQAALKIEVLRLKSFAKPKFTRSEC